MFIAKAVFVLSLGILSVRAHGFFYSADLIDFSRPIPKSNVRGIEKLTNGIDTLRNPNTAGLCRGLTTAKDPSPMNLEAGKESGVTMAFSVNAHHKGKCKLEIYDQNMKSPVVLAEDECATLERTYSNTGECQGRVPADLTTNDMCLTHWKFVPRQIPNCERCVLRWTWSAVHRLPAEEYENCIDVTIVGGGAGKVEQPKPETISNEVVEAQAPLVEDAPAANLLGESKKIPEESVMNTDPASKITEESAMIAEPAPVMKKKCKKRSLRK
jgi:hypothetical protein